jgi:hypothetical protein
MMGYSKMCSAKIGLNFLAQERIETDNSRTVNIRGDKNIIYMIINANKYRHRHCCSLPSP